jgi:predicted ester cyclase
MESETLNKAIVGRWFVSFWGDACDLAIVDELAAPDVVLQYSMHNPRRGQLAVKQFMADFREAFPDLCFRRIGALIADRDIVVVRWEGSGTHTGRSFHDFNIGPLPAASGHKIVLSGHTAVRLEDSTIAEEAVWSTERKSQLRPITGGLVLGLSTMGPSTTASAFAHFV